MARTVLAILAIVLTLGASGSASGGTMVYFNSSQTATNVSSGVTSDTISCEGYLFTYTRDKLFTGGYGMTKPIGRPVRVAWPSGIEAQAVTAGPAPSGATITIWRVDGGLFDLSAFSAKLLANTAGAGASIEVMPKLNGEDAFNDPIPFDATGYAGNTFSYNNTSPGYLGNTALLTGYEKYTISLYVDYAVTALTLNNIDPPPSTLLWSGAASGLWDVNTTANFSGSASGKYRDGDFVSFDDTASRTTVSIAAAGVSPGSVEFTNTIATTYTLSGGPIRGPADLILSGDGTVVLNNANSYTGRTIVNLGTLVIRNAAALPDGNSLTVGLNGAFAFGAGMAPVAAATSPVAVPEPSSVVLLGVGCLGLLVIARLSFRSVSPNSLSRLLLRPQSPP